MRYDPYGSLTNWDYNNDYEPYRCYCSMVFDVIQYNMFVLLDLFD